MASRTVSRCALIHSRLMFFLVNFNVVGVGVCFLPFSFLHIFICVGFLASTLVFGMCCCPLLEHIHLCELFRNNVLHIFVLFGSCAGPFSEQIRLLQLFSTHVMHTFVLMSFVRSMSCTYSFCVALLIPCLEGTHFSLYF